MILQVGHCQRYGENARLLLIDLDDFQQINDTHGHKIGDEMLQAVAGAIKKRVRATDYPARIGGDEFAVLLPHTSNGNAALAARGIERAIADTTIQLGAAGVYCRASIGIATIDESTPDAEAALLQADRAMYAAKRRKAAAATATTAAQAGSAAESS